MREEATNEAPESDEGYDQDEELAESSEHSQDSGSSVSGDEDLPAIQTSGSDLTGNTQTQATNAVSQLTRLNGPMDVFAGEYPFQTSSTGGTVASPATATTGVTPSAVARNPGQQPTTTIRTMDVASLIARINTSKTEMETLKKEVETLEKKAVRRGKDVVKWRDGIISAATNTSAVNTGSDGRE